ncbi:hypothetical protein GF420_06025 [candidate division GN15 bacterium]|nr:hypothetical protein [candidate division GN15 bacterium]
MKLSHIALVSLLGLRGLLLIGCNSGDDSATELRQIPLNGIAEVIDSVLVEYDAEHSADGVGSIRVETGEPIRVRLAEVGGIDIEDARLIYQASLRSSELQGTAYLEMWCQFAGKGEYFSRGLDNPVTGTSDWSIHQTPFFLKSGENPDSVKLNLVVEGAGTVWIDDIRLQRARL